MSPRRGFLAFLGGATVTGVATTRASATTPTLILPPALVPAAVTMPDARYPLLAKQPDNLRAFLTVGRLTPEDVFHDWLEGGLRTARLYNGRTEAETEAGLRANLELQAFLAPRETPAEAQARVVRLVDETAARWNGGRAGR